MRDRMVCYTTGLMPSKSNIKCFAACRMGRSEDGRCKLGRKDGWYLFMPQTLLLSLAVNFPLHECLQKHPMRVILLLKDMKIITLRRST